MPFFDGARGRMHYRRWPVDNGVASVLLLPGTGQHSGHYHRFARALRAADIETWALDTSGQGLSEGDHGNPGTLAELVADARMLFDLVHAASPRTPVILMGHSLGAVTVLALFGAAEPETAGASADSAALRAYPLRPALSADAVAGLVLSGTPKRALGGGASGAAGTPLPRGLPILAVHGVEDRRAPIDAVRVWTQRHESVDLREYADSGHDLLHEPVHARVAADIADWTQGVVVGLARRP
ncbi:alpha-beta hydrolase superfamily lysophospholipase [Nocardia tenerifensis]|uniref:Alpha-beta hydrolase superfamily lysophospholipase n=1 Tax=Nocardia tenerifensis TaxID=228006 RepID=A0A318KAZ1_9NOCA|nr:alpha/beta fold hydrolase [Nocardia tenerifensis]PXX68902.1 alpha-beta hydrolase superfamily lysophospholipase [Nocardia tenerifensis]